MHIPPLNRGVLISQSIPRVLEKTWAPKPPSPPSKASAQWPQRFCRSLLPVFGSKLGALKNFEVQKSWDLFVSFDKYLLSIIVPVKKSTMWLRRKGRSTKANRLGEQKAKSKQKRNGVSLTKVLKNLERILIHGFRWMLYFYYVLEYLEYITFFETAVIRQLSNRFADPIQAFAKPREVGWWHRFMLDL